MTPCNPEPDSRCSWAMDTASRRGWLNEGGERQVLMMTDTMTAWADVQPPNRTRPLANKSSGACLTPLKSQGCGGGPVSWAFGGVGASGAEGRMCNFVPFAVTAPAPVFLLMVHSALCWPFSLPKTCPLAALFGTVQLSHTHHSAISQQFLDFLILQLIIYTKDVSRLEIIFSSLCLEGFVDLHCPFLKIRGTVLGCVLPLALC